MTNEEAIRAEALRYWNARLNVDGSRNGSVVFGCYKRLKAVFKANGAEHNEACKMAGNVAYRQFREDLGR